MNPVTIQINSLAALERLLGGDTELELSLRKSVAMAFGDKHLKAIAETPFFQQAANGLIGALKKQAQDTFDAAAGKVHRSTWGNQITHVTLTPEVKKAIDDRALELVRDTINSAVKRAVEGVNLEKAINAAVDIAVARRVGELVRARLQEVTSKLT